MLIGGSTSIAALQTEGLDKRPVVGGGSVLSRALQRFAPVASPNVAVKAIHPTEHYDLGATISEAELRRTDEDSYLRYSAYASRPFILAEGREIITALHSKAIIVPPKGLIDEFNVGGGAGIPAYLLEQDFERRAHALCVPASKVERQRGFSIPLCHYGIGTFGHFVLDALLQVYTFRRDLENGARLLHWPLPGAWMGAVLDRCGGARRREVTAGVIQMERAGLSSALAGHGVYFPGSWSVGFFEWLRTRMEVPHYPGGGRLFVRRAPGFGRVIGNADDLETLAQSHGFVAISPEVLPLDEQMRLFASSGVVLSAWGSTLSLAPMLASSRIVVELLPSSVRDAWFPRQAAVHGLDYRPLLQAADTAGNMDIDLDTLDILLRTLPA